MSFTVITAAEILVGQPAGPTLWGKVKDSLDYLFGAIGGLPPTNGNFEVDSDADGIPDSWTRTLYPGGTGGQNVATPAQGAAGVYFIHPGGAGNGGGELWSDYLPISEYATYYANFITWASAAGMKNKVQVQYYTAAKAANGAAVDLYSSTSNPATPTFYTYQFTPTANSRFVKIGVIGGYTDTAVAGTAYFDAVEFGTCVTSLMLKTAQGNVSNISSTATNYTLPGGEYGFYPQIKMSGSTNTYYQAQICGSAIDSATFSFAGWTSYTTNICLEKGTGGIYAQQRYVTASGEVFWIFLLRDKNTKDIMSAWAAPDHPCYGNGGKPELIGHPFRNFDNARQEVICINPSPEQLKDIMARTIVDDENLPDRDILDVIMEDYAVDEGSEPKWCSIPITVGLPKDRDWKRVPDGEKVTPIRKLIPQPADVVKKEIRLKAA